MSCKGKSIKVCQGPGCKAWGAKAVLRTLKCHFKQAPETMVGTSPCMNRCGGGAAVKLGSRKKPCKIRETHAAVDHVLGRLQ